MQNSEVLMLSRHELVVRKCRWDTLSMTVKCCGIRCRLPSAAIETSLRVHGEGAKPLVVERGSLLRNAGEKTTFYVGGREDRGWLTKQP